MKTGGTYQEITMEGTNTPADELRFKRQAVEYFVGVGEITPEQEDMVKVKSSMSGRFLSATVEE